jgi:hypothetical protein
MQQVHVRNIFQLFIPLSGQTNTGYAITLGGSPSQGLTLTQGSTNYSYHYQVKLLSCDESVESVREESMVWAKRNPYHLQTRDQFIEGIVVRIKINTGVFDFRRGKQRNIRFVVDCFNSETLVGRGASALCQLLPKRRNVDESSIADDETLVPISWSSNNYSSSYEKSSPEETSPFAYNTSSPPDDDDSMMQGYSPSDVDASYETSNSNSLVPVNDYASNEQYMVLYNGNAEVIGNFRALNFYKASDINLKEDIRLLQEDYNCREMLMQIDGVEYKFKQGVKNSMNKRFVGYIAQQVEKVVPEAVQLIDGILHVDYESLIPYLSESIRDNYEDLKQIRKVVDVLYGEFLKNEQLKAQKKTSYDTTANDPCPSANLSPSGNFVFIQRTKSKPWRWTLGLMIALTLVVSAALATFLMWNSEPIIRLSPLFPATSTPHDKFNTTTDKLALENMYKTMNGPHWKYSYGWMSKVSVCTWDGVKCDSDSRVVDLNLENGNLTGKLQVAIANLTRLKKLNLRLNSIHGTIPEFLFAMPSLEVLVLTRCNLTGTIPAAIIANKNLSVVSLGYNNLTGTVPVIGPKSRIKSFELTSNNFTGTFPLIHTDLSDLFISNNHFSGEFSLSDEALPTIQKLDISNNHFSILRDSFFNLTSLKTCNAARNEFKCPIPVWTYKKCNAACTSAT